MAESPATHRIAVIGAGISGLAAALRLRELAPQCDVTIFEASTRAGGTLQTTTRDGYLIEHAADNFISNVPAGVNFFQRQGLADELIGTDETRRRAFVVRGGRLHVVPEGFALMAPAKLWPVITTRLLSPWGKMRLLREAFVKRRDSEEDESLQDFVTRRLGREVFQRIVQPLVSGIYTADPTKLSLAATMPRFQEMERRHGGLIRAAWKANRNQPGEADASGARYSLFLAPRQGMAWLVDQLVSRLPAGTLRTDSRVEAISKTPEGWQVATGGEPSESATFDGVIIATAAPLAAKLIEPLDTTTTKLLRGIPYAGAAIASLGFRRRQITGTFNGFGFVVPAIERRPILAASFSSNKFPHRAPTGGVLIRTFVGGALQPEMLEKTDDEIQSLVCTQLRELIGLVGEPELVQINRWTGAMPQYHVGHLENIENLDLRMAKHPGLELAGSAYRGVGIPHCITSGEAAAQRIVDSFSKSPD